MRKRFSRQYRDECLELYPRQEVSSQINSRNAGTDGAEQVGSDGADAAGEEICGKHMFSVRAVDGGYVSQCDLGHVCDVDHGDVHGDDADDGRENTAHQHTAFVAEGAMDAVAISGGKHGDSRCATG